MVDAGTNTDAISLDFAIRRVAIGLYAAEQ